MNKTLIIIGREFTTSRERSFLVLTLVVPILLAVFMLPDVDASERRHTGP